MKKHSLALAFALIGMGIGGFFVANSSNPSIAIVIACACFGAFVGYFVAGLLAQHSPLQSVFRELGDMRGMSLEQITAKAGMYSSSRPCKIAGTDNEDGVLYVWSDDKYSLTLLFDTNGKCLGVNKEERL